MAKQVSVAVLGVGLIGLDLIEKIQRSAVLDCRLAVGRDDHSFGLYRAAELGCLCFLVWRSGAQSNPRCGRVIGRRAGDAAVPP